MKAGEIYENPVTGECAQVRVGTLESGGEELVADLRIRAGGAVMGEHYHPEIEERFTVLRGLVAFRLDGRMEIAEIGHQVIVPPGMAHDWWNAGEEDAVVRVEIRPGARFETMIRNAYGLAQDGKTDAKGLPDLLQMALFAREFDDVVRFTRHPRWVQRVLFGILAPVAKLMGYRGSYPKYLGQTPLPVAPVEEFHAPACQPAGAN